MSIHAIAKKKLGFRNGETGEILTVEPFQYATLPDWVKKDPMYEWSIRDGSLEVPKQEKTKKPEPPSKPPEGGDGDDKQ